MTQQTAAIAETSLKDLDPRVKKQVENAQKNIDKNANYTIDICTGILERNPGCLDVRKILRKAQQRAGGGKKSGFSSFLKNVTNAPFAMKVSSQLDKDPKAAIEAAEKLITANPNNANAHKIVGQAAEKLGLWDTAVFAYECIKAFDSANTENTLFLGNALIEAKRAKEAIEVLEGVLRGDPSNADCQEMLKRASVAISMDKGKWEEEGSFHDKVADKEKTIELEQAARVTNDDETLEKLIAKNLAKIEDEPENINLYREVVSGYRSMGDFDNALLYLGRAREVPSGKADATLERLETELKVQKMEATIDAKRAELEADPQSAGIKSELEALEKARFDFQLANAKELVERYPNDYEARFSLGKFLLQISELDGAIQQFQLAQKNPKVRLEAILYLGRAYLAKKFSDLAIEQLIIAKSEMPVVNELKKEVVYELASAYEQMGDEKKAIEEYKHIYAADIGYKDVAEKINQFYAKQQSGS